MTPVLQFMLAVILIISAAKLAGLVSTRLGQPAVLGEILAGVVLGPSVIDILGLPFMTDTHLGETLTMLAETGVVLLMFVAGLEVDLGQMRRAGRVVILAGTFGVAVPLLMGWGVALPFGFSASQAFYIGMLLTATSVSISAQTLLELGVLRSRVGIALLGAAVVDDVLVIFLLSAMLAVVTGTGGAAGILVLVLRMGVYVALFAMIGHLVLPRLLARLDRWPVSQGLLAGTVVITLLYAWAAEVIGGVALITGAFLAGIFVARTSLRHRIEEGMSVLTYSFFVPIFFVNIGLHANVRELQGDLIWLTLVITVIAIISKVIGSGLGALAGGFDLKQSLRLGTGMISRGEVGLIVASLEVRNGLVGPEILTLAVVMVLVTTLVTPPLLRVVFHGETTAQGTARPRRAPQGD